MATNGLGGLGLTQSGSLGGLGLATDGSSGGLNLTMGGSSTGLGLTTGGTSTGMGLTAAGSSAGLGLTIGGSSGLNGMGSSVMPPGASGGGGSGVSTSTIASGKYIYMLGRSNTFHVLSKLPEKQVLRCHTFLWPNKSKDMKLQKFSNFWPFFSAIKAVFSSSVNPLF